MSAWQNMENIYFCDNLPSIDNILLLLYMSYAAVQK